MEKLSDSATSVPMSPAVLVSSWLPIVIVSTADAATRSMFPRLNRRYTEFEGGMDSVLGIEGKVKDPGDYISCCCLLHKGAAGAGVYVANFSKNIALWSVA